LINRLTLAAAFAAAFFMGDEKIIGLALHKLPKKTWEFSRCQEEFALNQVIQPKVRSI